MNTIESHIVPSQNKPIRLSDYARSIFESVPSRKGVKKAIKAGRVFVNGTVAQTSTLLSGGEKIDLRESSEKKVVFKFDLQVLFEDDDLAVIDKPAGMLVSGNHFRTVENALPHNLSKSTTENVLKYPRPVHRLDFLTRGVLLVAKTSECLNALKHQFEHRGIKKIYHAITIGSIPEHGVNNAPIDGKEAHTEYRIIESISAKRYGQLNLVELSPITGRRHQLRKHMAGLGSPILGDNVYIKSGPIGPGKGLYLHASRLVFNHPVTGKEMDVACDLPRKFYRILEKSTKHSKAQKY